MLSGKVSEAGSGSVFIETKAQTLFWAILSYLFFPLEQK